MCYRPTGIGSGLQPAEPVREHGGKRDHRDHASDRRQCEACQPEAVVRVLDVAFHAAVEVHAPTKTAPSQHVNTFLQNVLLARS